MTKARTDSKYLMFQGSAGFLLLGLLLIGTQYAPVADFRVAYYQGACVRDGCDPYSRTDMEKIYAKYGQAPFASDRIRLEATRNIYLPSELPFLVPIALLPFGVAQALWLFVIAGSFIFSSFLVWRLGAENAPLVSSCLLAFSLANSGSVLYFGNAAGFVVPFIVVAAWCFVYEKFVYAGIACLAFSLVFKPHDAAFFWLFFLLAGGTFRRRALQTIVPVSAVCLLSVFWIQNLSPHWARELSENIHIKSMPGGVNDPGHVHGTEMLTNLQSITSFFWNDPHTFDLASYLICAPLIITWAVVTWRSRPSQENAWFGLASIAAFTVLPVYHRQYDAKLIMLVVPALSILWARRDKLRCIGIFLTTAAFVLNGDLPWVIFLALLKKLHLFADASYGRLLTAVCDFPVPLSLLAVGIFYLWVYVQSSRHSAEPTQLHEFQQVPASPAMVP
jgi:hypothetical protein